MLSKDAHSHQHYMNWKNGYQVCKEECVEEVDIGNVVIMLLLYADDVVLLANTLGDAQKLMKALEIFACILN